MGNNENFNLSAAIDCIMDMMLNDENYPADRKVDIAIMKAGKDIPCTIRDIIKQAVIDEKLTLEKKKELAEYLTCVQAGLLTYAQTNNLEV